MVAHSEEPDDHEIVLFLPKRITVTSPSTSVMEQEIYDKLPVDEDGFLAINMCALVQLDGTLLRKSGISSATFFDFVTDGCKPYRRLSVGRMYLAAIPTDYWKSKNAEEALPWLPRAWMMYNGDDSHVYVLDERIYRRNVDQQILDSRTGMEREGMVARLNAREVECQGGLVDTVPAEDRVCYQVPRAMFEGREDDLERFLGIEPE